MPTILDKIVASKRREIAAAKLERPDSKLRAALDEAPPTRDFIGALSAEGPIKLIAEIKKASPSKGVLCDNFDPVKIAKTYERHGATCLSVLTDAPFFQGSLGYLRDVRAEVDLPVLCKDFILDTHQLLEARLAGADAVLLIAECLDDCLLRKLHTETIALGMTALVEFYEPDHLERVLEAGAVLIGVNNRDLRTFDTDLQHTVRMMQHIPDHCVVVGESGIHSRQDAVELEKAGVHAMLVGEHLMVSPDMGLAVLNILGRSS